MPRAVKREHQDSELKYTRISLENLNRKQIQELAKKERIKANMSTQKIIAAVLKLFKGPEEDIVVLETVQDEVEPTVADIQEENCAPKVGSRHDGPGAATSQPAPQSVSSGHESGSPGE
ncbi:hypothetical protein GALMADRAFT_496088 [Galerina marginata CBS 339.88]|uniref:Uncharacterized protein n=1 Tax=Galerina marginata (strain CBS 339.88) TaxID=685588 RepID=A0A067SXL2_GALM3|nr:hypothetical protein GALMADRAFT_496088 [Galerina marginata CBS 339.88]